MILETAAVLFLVCGFGMLSRLFASRRNLCHKISKSMQRTRRGSWSARTARTQYPAAPHSLQVGLPDDEQSSFFRWEDKPRSSPLVRTDRQRRGIGAGESVCRGGADSMSRELVGPHQHEWPAGRIFRPCKRPSLGL